MARFLSCELTGVLELCLLWDGTDRCDNRIARVLVDGGLQVTNPSPALHCYHLHTHNHVHTHDRRQTPDAGGLGSYSAKEQVLGPMAHVMLSSQWLF